MIFHSFYNLNNVGDILLARLGEGKTYSYDVLEDLVVLKDSKENIIGYNLLKASSYLGELNNGLVKFSEEQEKKFNDLLTNNNLPLIEVDRTCRFIVGEVLAMEDHPDSDHLHVCQVNLGNSVTQIVCGAKNVEANQYVVVATIGAVMPSGMLIKPSKLRKVESNGMICSARELALPNAPDKSGILVLDKEVYSVGDSFF